MKLFVGLVAGLAVGAFAGHVIGWRSALRAADGAQRPHLKGAGGIAGIVYH